MSDLAETPPAATIGANSSSENVGASFHDGQRTSTRIQRILKIVLPALGFAALAGVVCVVGGPLVERLPADYRSEMRMDAEGGFRESLAVPMQTSPQIGRRVDQVVTVSGDVAVIQAGVDWTDPSGNLLYQTTGLYGVDRRTQSNLSGYGDRDRVGQFLIPPRFEETTFQLWDPNYSGPRTVAFERVDELDGLPVMVYRHAATGFDETAAYDFLPDVPERYKAFSDGHGLLYVEPVSGVVVDFTDEGRSYFVDPVTGASLGDFTTWRDWYAPETKAAQLRLAASRRSEILLVEQWLPSVLLGLALLWVTASLLRSRPAARPNLGLSAGR